MKVSLTRAALMLALARQNLLRAFPTRELTVEDLRDYLVERSILSPSERVVLHYVHILNWMLPK